MKKVWLYCLALMAMTFAIMSPAQAHEGCQGFAPSADGLILVDVGGGTLNAIPGPGSGDAPAIDNRSTVQQLEAAALLASKSSPYIEVAGLAKPDDNGFALGSGPFEVGWSGLAGWPA